MKWTLTIEGLDLGDAIPDGSIAPEQWALEYVFSLLNNLHCDRLEKRIQLEEESNLSVKAMLVKLCDEDIAVTRAMRDGFTLKQENGE